MWVTVCLPTNDLGKPGVISQVSTILLTYNYKVHERTKGGQGVFTSHLYPKHIWGGHECNKKLELLGQYCTVDMEQGGETLASNIVSCGIIV